MRRSAAPDPLAERVTFASPPECPGAQVLRVENCTRLFSVYHTSYEVCSLLPRPAYSTWRYRGRTYETQSRGTSFMEPGEYHRNLRMHGVGDFRVLLLPPDVLRRVASEDDGPETPHFGVMQTQDPLYYRTFTRLHASLERPASRLERESRYSACLDLLRRGCLERTRTPARGGEERRAVRLAKDYLRAHLAQNVSLEDLAAAAGLNRFPLLRAFKREVGVPPHAYHLGLRVARAREFLAGRLPLAEIALRLGFFDQSHFNRHFKRSLGVSPGEYAAQVQTP